MSIFLTQYTISSYHHHLCSAVPILDQVSAVHHYVVYLQSECNLTDEVFLTRSLLYAWAPGDQGLALPNDVGFPLFDTENNQAIDIEIHYNNPALTSGMIDSSGLRFYYVNDERTYRAGVYQTGDPFVGLMEIAPEINDGLTQHTFTCPSECSSLYLGATDTERSGDDHEGVTIISEGTTSRVSFLLLLAQSTHYLVLTFAHCICFLT